MKIAVYVEGLTELIFVREFLIKWYGYDGSIIGLECFELRSSKTNPADYSYGNKDSERFYTIVNTGGDVMALSKALENASNHRNSGYDRVIVLRDMYCEDYKKRQPGQIIDLELNNRFIEGAQKSIDNKNFNGYVYCYFAVMEIEAWILGMGWYLVKHHSTLTQDYLLTKLKFDLNVDPETSEYHPAVRLKRIYEDVGLDYRKHESELNSIMGCLDKNDFQMLLDLGKCDSFSKFVKSLTN